MPITINWPTSADTKPTVPERMNQSPTHPEILDFILTLLMRIETELGNDPSAASATVRARLDAIVAGGISNPFGNVYATNYVRAGTANQNPAFKVGQTGGTLNGSGGGSYAHNVSDGAQRIFMVYACYNGPSNEQIAIPNVTTDGGFFYIAHPAAANKKVKIGFLYSEVSVVWSTL